MGVNAAMIVDVENVTGSRLPAVETRRKIKDKSGVANWLDKISLSGFANFSSQPTFPVLKLSLTERLLVMRLSTLTSLSAAGRARLQA